MALPHQLMNEEQLKAWILRRLGYPHLKIELGACDIQDAVDQARHWFSAKKGAKRIMLMPLVPEQTVYELPPEVDTVLDVAFPVPPMDISLVFSPYILIDDKVPYDVFSAPGSIGLYSSFTQTLQYVEMAKRVLGAENDWLQMDRQLLIAPHPKYNHGLYIFYKTNMFTLEQLNERDHDLLKRYALALAKGFLGRVRSKYDTYPAAQGTVSLDGERLLEESKTEIEALDEEIGLSGYPMGFMTG